MIGLIGRKAGMTQVFDEAGVLTPVSVVQIEPNLVVKERTSEKDGYSAVVLASGTMKKSRTRKPYAGQFPEGMEPRKNMAEVRDFGRECKVGDALGVELFENVKFVDVHGTSKGKGTQGVIKRHGFHGGPGSHGSKFHREAGSTGNAATPSKTVKGRPMAGRMGNEGSTSQNLMLVRIDKEKGALLIRGAIPGRRNGIVVVTQALKKKTKA